MYCADSNILSILLAVITLAAGIYSSSAKRKKGDEDVVQMQNAEDAEDDLSFESIFEGLGLQEQTEADDRLSVQNQEEIQEKIQEEIQEKIQEKIQEDAQAQEPVAKEKSNDVKSRLKSSPKDAVLFAEILKPKYKEF